MLQALKYATPVNEQKCKSANDDDRPDCFAVLDDEGSCDEYQRSQHIAFPEEEIIVVEPERSRSVPECCAHPHGEIQIDSEDKPGQVEL